LLSINNWLNIFKIIGAFSIIASSSFCIKELTELKIIPYNSYGDIVMLRNSHVGHDSIIEDKANLSCNVLIGGHSHIMEGANLGLGAMCHQFLVIGAYAMVGMGGVIVKSSIIQPGEIHVGNPVKFLKENKIGLQRNNIDSNKLLELTNRYFLLANK
jgi:acyl-[acyl carrier protein]--UDP-N-acetylglucosamine O-acyltransferase